MNVIVSNKQKSVLDNANIEAIKDLSGLFNVDELINNFKGYFFSKIIIDATSIVDFANENTLKKLANGFGSEKLIILLPPKPEPPKKFCDYLMSLGIYNYSTNIDDIINFLKDSETNNSNEQDIYNVNNFDTNVSQNQIINENSNINENNQGIIKDLNQDRKIVIGFKNVTLHAGSTTLIYMIKQHLEKKYNIFAEAFEVNSGDFKFFNTNNMYEVNQNNLQMTINNSKSNVILIDVSNSDSDILCDDVIYLIEPSILKINRLLNEKRDIFRILDGKKVILNKSMLTEDEGAIFAKEAGIKIYYNIPFVNDRNDNQIIDDFIAKLGIISKRG